MTVTAHPLHRLLRLVELPTLDGVLAHDAVDGKHIVSNVRPVTRAIKARLHKPHLITPSTHHSDHGKQSLQHTASTLL